MSHHHVKLHRLINGVLQSFAHSFDSIEEAKEFIVNTPDVHSAQVYDNGNLVHAQDPQPEPVAPVDTPVVEAPVVEAPVDTPVVEAPVDTPVVEAPVVEAPVVEAPVDTPVDTPVVDPVVDPAPAAPAA